MVAAGASSGHMTALTGGSAAALGFHSACRKHSDSCMACLGEGLQKEIALLRLHDKPQALCLQPGVPPALTLVICVLVHICISEEGPGLTAVSPREALSRGRRTKHNGQ